MVPRCANLLSIRINFHLGKTNNIYKEKSIKQRYSLVERLNREQAKPETTPCCFDPENCDEDEIACSDGFHLSGVCIEWENGKQRCVCKENWTGDYCRTFTGMYAPLLLYLHIRTIANHAIAFREPNRTSCQIHETNVL